MIGAQYNLPANSETIAKRVPVEEFFISSEIQNAGYYTGIVRGYQVPMYNPNFTITNKILSWSGSAELEAKLQVGNELYVRYTI